MMYEDLNRIDKKKVALGILLVMTAAAVFGITYFNIFGFADMLEAGGVKPARLYVGIFCAFVGIFPLLFLRRILTDTPMKSLEKYAQTTENPEAVLERLKETWKSGYQLREWCHMDEAYIIAFINGAYATVIPVKEVVWAYKEVTRLNYVVKTNTSLFVRYANQKSGVIPMGEAGIDFILQQFMEKHPDIAVGHTGDAEKLYQRKDMDGLKEYAHQQRIGSNL